MNELALLEEVSGFRQLFETLPKLSEYGRRLGIMDDHLAICLCRFYAIWHACQIHKCLSSLFDRAITLNQDLEKDCLDSAEMLPNHGVVKQAAHNLLLAVTSGDKLAIHSALRDMGVFALCPPSEAVFPAMENVTSRVNGPAQQVFVVELALFASEVGDYERAHAYIHQAHTFGLSSRELYNVCVIE